MLLKKSLLASVLLNYVKPISCNIVTEQIISWLRKICGCNYLFILMFVIKPSSCCLHPLYDERSIRRRWESAEMTVNYQGVRRRRAALVQMVVRAMASALVFCWYYPLFYSVAFFFCCSCFFQSAQWSDHLRRVLSCFFNLLHIWDWISRSSGSKWIEGTCSWEKGWVFFPQFNKWLIMQLVSHLLLFLQV